MNWDTDRVEEACALQSVANPYVRIRNLHRSFGQRHILRGIDLDVERGETLVILGTSGSGKTTLLKHLMGSLQVEEGDIHVGDYDLTQMNGRSWSAYRRELGVVFQHAALLGSLTVEENVGLALREVRRLPEDKINRRVVRALERVFLPAEEILHFKPSSLSGGMRKRVGLARAIVQEPELMLYDEPTTGLDPVTVTAVGELIREIQGNLGATSIVITHDMDIAWAVADRIAMLFKGRIIACGTPGELRSNEHPAVRQLLSGSVDGPLTEDFVKRGASLRSASQVLQAVPKELTRK